MAFCGGSWISVVAPVLVVHYSKCPFLTACRNCSSIIFSSTIVCIAQYASYGLESRSANDPVLEREAPVTVHRG